MPVPYTFATATGSIPLSQLDANFAIGMLIGSTNVGLGNTVTTISDLTLSNVTISSGSFPASSSFANVTLTGTTTFSGSGARIQGDFSGTLANRTAFQSSTTNGVTAVFAFPNGTGTDSGWYAFNNSDPTNAAYVAIDVLAASGAARLLSTRTGSGTALPLTFNVGNTGAERARIDTNGRFLVYRTSWSTPYTNTQGLTILPEGQIAAENPYSSGSTFYSNIYSCGGNSCNNMQFYREGIAAGVIVTNSSAQTSYAASSDYRLKSNAQPLSGSGAFIDALQPKTWTWTTSGQPGAGFIAHEVSTVSPSSVFGEKDAVDANGAPIYQSMEYGSAEFIANIVAELQSLRARVAALESA